MVNFTTKGLVMAIGLIGIIGCASSGVEVKRYVEVRERVDQDMEGNAGFVGGEPKEIDRSNIRKTRKVYVMEVSQQDPIPNDAEVVIEGGEVDMAEGGEIPDGAFINDGPSYESDNYIEVSRDSVPEPFYERPDDPNSNLSGIVESTEYKVKKDDTLQKISKKFYDSYSKWPRIYEANKDVIENPDRIKPGIVIQIPAQ